MKKFVTLTAVAVAVVVFLGQQQQCPPNQQEEEYQDEGGIVLYIDSDADGADAFTTGPMPTDAKAVFLHHSTGKAVWDGGVPALVERYNMSHGTQYLVDEQDFPSADLNFPYHYWNYWVNHGDQEFYNDEPTLQHLTQNYDVVVWKHCYPATHVEPDCEEPSVGSDTMCMQNYQLQYNALRDKMHEYPDNRFIVWTGAANVEAMTMPEYAARGRQWVNWVKNEWDQPNDNIYVWDFYELQTQGTDYFLADYALSPEDSHPNAMFAAEIAAPRFVNRLTDVLQGDGDADGLTGETNE